LGTELVFLFCFSILSGNSLDQDNSLNTLMMLVSQMIATFVIFDWHLSNFQILFLLLLNDYACMRTRRKCLMKIIEAKEVCLNDASLEEFCMHPKSNNQICRKRRWHCV
jgi:hypothetical protein